MQALAPRAPAAVSDAVQLEATMLELVHDPLAFVLSVFPWNEAGPLAGMAGPYEWQADILREIGERLRAQAIMGTTAPIRITVASGHGIGKSALMAWIKLWALCTFPEARAVITAGTEQQLRGRTWPEIVKWFNLLPCKHWFTITDTTITARDPACEKTWRGDRVTWSEHNVEAFQGLHNLRKRIVLLFDEASAIADAIWNAAEGSLTDEETEILWICFGNPTKNAGRFRETHGAQRHRWSARQIDARTVPGTNKDLHDEWAADYGEDSDFFRVRVRGEFPRAGSQQFIGGDLVDAATKREAVAHLHDALVIGVDVARHGDDQTVIFFRRGRDARTIAPIKLRIHDLMQIAARVVEAAREHHADATFVDMGGMGVGVVDRLNQLGVPGVFGVDFGSKPAGVSFNGETAAYANRRAEIWGCLKAWLPAGAIPDDAELKADLVGPEYGFNARNEIQLERKADMKRRGLASPDNGDALALTFAYPVQPRGGSRDAMAGRVAVDYDPYAEDFA